MQSSVTSQGSPYLKRIESPIGRIEVSADESAITVLAIERSGLLPGDDRPECSSAILDRAAAQLDEYFAGTRAVFDLEVRAHGTPFQRSVWHALAEIPYGVVSSYGQIGLATGRSSAGRAVGGAVGANPIPIIIPCHRVLGSNGRITGYSGGDGILTKAWLLDHEGIEHR